MTDGYNNLRFQTHGVAWFFVVGWLVHRSTALPLKVLTTVVCVLAVPGFFHRPERGWFIALGLILLLWRRDLPLPRPAVRAVALVAAASMAIFISHFRIWPPLSRNLPDGVAYVATIGAGVVIWVAAERAARAAQPVWARAVRRRGERQHQEQAVPLPA